MGLLPYPEFWAKSTYGQPGATILLHFISTTIIVISTPLEDNNGYLVASTLYTYTRTWVGSKSSLRFPPTYFNLNH